jgi:hypothetical protein
VTRFPSLKRPLLPVLAAAAIALAAPASVQAAVTVFGSDLSKPANLVEDHGPDSAFWNASIDGDPGRAIVPADGQITLARVKGIVLQDPSGRQKPDPMWHLQVLHPQGNGSVRVDLSSGAFRLPLGGDPQQVTGYRPVNLCVHRGDYVDFNDIGGFQWRWGNYQGMPFQIFSRVPTGATNFYSADNGTNVGAVFRPAETKQEELLMQTTLASGPDATDICPGGYQQHVFSGLKVVSNQTAVLRTRTRIVKVKALCPGPSYGGCKGVLSMDATFGSANKLVGSATFNIKAAYTQSIEVKLSPANVKLIQKARGLATNVNVQSHDDPKSDKRAGPAGIPVQSQVTTANVRIKPDKLTSKKKRHH